MPFYREAAGLEIGPDSLKLLYAKRRGLFVRVLCVEQVALSGDPQETVLLLRNLMEQHHLQRVPCVLGLRGESLLLRVMDIGKNDLRPVADLVEEQLDHYQGVAGDEVLCEHIVLKKEGGGRRILFAVMREDTAWEALRAPGEAEIRVVDAVPGSIALFNGTAALRGLRKSSFLIAEIGPESTEITAGSSRTLLFNRRFPRGWKSFLGNSRNPLTPDEWLTELEACLTFYRTHYPASRFRPDKLYIRCERPLPPAFIEQTAKRIGFPTQLLDQPTFNRKLKGPASLFACAYGLALAGLGAARIRFTLLPAGLKEKLILRWQLKYWATAVGCAIVACLILVSAMYKEQRRIEESVTELAAQLEHFQAQEKELTALQEVNQLLRRRIEPLRISQMNGQRVLAVLKAVTDSKHPDDWITLIADSESYDTLLLRRNESVENEERERTRSEPRESPANDLRLNRFVVEGYTVSRELATVLTMIEKLRANPVIAEVDLLADDRLRNDEERDAEWAFTEGQIFAIEIEMIQL